jgi:hypothetical protein
MTMFDPNVRFVPPPKRPGATRRMLISWGLTALIVAVLLGAVFFGLPGWLATVLILGVLVVASFLSRRWR